MNSSLTKTIDESLLYIKFSSHVKKISNIISIDIGGSLIKIAHFEENDNDGTCHRNFDLKI